MSMNISSMTLPELFKLISNLPPARRVEHLREISNLKPEVKLVLELTYHSRIIFDLPSGTPPYKVNNIPENWGYNRLTRELRKFKYFLKGNTLNSLKRESIFVEMLESLSAEEAKLVLSMKDKKMPYKGFSKKMAMEAIPEIFIGEKEEENV